ncbi:putative anamorsin, S-adenosyl-L-methionine-dependent methyltransferase [Rosa chinensis]|uniref:Putative anamorsin, S-adenosyl-L-methionine-dependent methyltransferase n=1 Tax=Rosa chinensis TaxID=74649 RepID=A0A2P6R5I9_ROSCH|nr:putative anamorsin, S-adenosyl-L-methionine-dependent methyltransferase [Rosa chinensis]
MQGSVLAFTDDVVLPTSLAFDALRELGNGASDKCEPQIITQVSSLSRFLPPACFLFILCCGVCISLDLLRPLLCGIKGQLLDKFCSPDLNLDLVMTGQLPQGTSSIDIVVALCRSIEFLSEQLLKETSRVLKPGGTILVYKTYETDKVKAKKPSWKIGSSFALKKPSKTLPKLQIDDHSDLIDEDSLLTEEDLKKPQPVVADDCEVGSTRKACKNCTCGRAEAEQKVEKLQSTVDLSISSQHVEVVD